MKKIMLFLVLLLCICGCQSNLKSDEEVVLDAFNETIYGQNNKNTKEAMTVDEAKAKIVDFNSLYDKIEYYGVVKYAPVSAENEYYGVVKYAPVSAENEYHAFLAMKDDNNVYILLDIYNSVLTFATAEQLGIKN